MPDEASQPDGRHGRDVIQDPGPGPELTEKPPRFWLVRKDSLAEDMVKKLLAKSPLDGKVFFVTEEQLRSWREDIETVELK